MKKLLWSSLLLFAWNVHAVNVSVSTSCGTLPGTADDATTLCGQLNSEVQALVDEDLPDVTLGKYGTGIANANSFAQSGLGSDYSDKFDIFMIRAAGGAAVQGELDDMENAEGVALGATATIGINLDLLPINKVGPIELEKMDLFVSFIGYDMDRTEEDTEVEGEISALGIMARYQIVDGVDIIPGSLLKWGGVFVHTGFQRSSLEAKITQKFDNETVSLNGGQSATFGDASATFDAKVATNKIPFEVSSYLRAAYVFTFFGGAGFDLVSGSTDVDLAASGVASGNGAASGFTSTISADESDSGDADATNFRAFGGLQFNVPFVRLTAQFNKGLGNDLFGVNFGAKILW